MSNGLTNLSREDVLQQRISELQSKVRSLEIELDSYTADNKWGTSYLQSKIALQRNFLARMSRRIRIQRLMLRELNHQNPELANDLFHLVFDKYADELGEDTGLTL